MTTPDELDERFRAATASLVAAMPRPATDPRQPVRPGSGLTGARALDLFEAQLASRHLDLAARWLRGRGEGYYTIGSSGHEGNAAVAAAVRASDPALLHYRSGAFYCARAAQAGLEGMDAVRDVLRGIVAAATDPIAAGRHKVFGHPQLAVIPTTSTIASHLPRAVGLAYAIERPRRLGGDPPEPAGAWPEDAIVVCSFGDASVNHAVAQAALNTSGWFDHVGVGLPLLYVCEDNGLGISVRSPEGWVAGVLGSRPGLRYLAADGCDLAEAYDAATEAALWVREQRRPAVLHLSLVRLMGHAGADVEVGYRPAGEIAADLGRDPLVQTARLLVEAGLLDAEQVLARYEATRARVRTVAERVLGEPRLADAAQVMAPLAPRRPVRVARAVADAGKAAAGPARAARSAGFGGRLPETAGPLTLAASINAALTDAMLAEPAIVVFGQDVAAKGGVYGVTKGLSERFGAERVFDTLLDETSILGLALGAALSGLLPVPEIQYLAYLHNAEDQLRGEAASLQFFSAGAYQNPLVVRVAGLADPEGFGGHFHNENSLAVLRDIPGVVLAVPARAADAAPMLRTCLAAAREQGSVCVFLEPIALYHRRDLHRPGDRGWLAPYRAPAQWAQEHIPIGRARRYGSGGQLTILTFGNGVPMSLRVAARLAADGLGARVVDLRWLNPLPVADIAEQATATGRVLVVDETRRGGGVGEGVLAALSEARFAGPVHRVAAADSYIPLGAAAGHVLVSEESVEQGARSLLGG